MSNITEQDIAAFKMNEKKWDDFCLNKEWDKLSEMLAVDVVAMPPNEPAMKGKEAVIAWFEKFPPIRAMTSVVTHAEGRDDFACARGTTTITIETEPGKTLSMQFKWSCSFRKQQDGSWLYASLIWNTDEPMTAG